jgi:hypothetical protein
VKVIPDRVVKACSDSELTSETVNRLRYFGRSPSTGDKPIVRPFSTYIGQHNIKCADIHPYPKRVSNT